MIRRLSVFLMMMVFFLFFFAGAGYSMPEVSIPALEVSEGTATVQIPINIDNATGVAGFQFTVIFDPDVLNATGAVAGSLAGGWSVMPNPNTPGQLQVGGFDGTLQGLPGGTGSLVLMNFNVVGSAGDSTPLTMTVAELNNNMAVPIAKTLVNGSLDIIESGFSIHPSQDVVEFMLLNGQAQGEEVAVDIEYIGAFTETINLSTQVHPAGAITAEAVPASIVPPASSFAVEVGLLPDAAPGVYTITVTGQSPSLTQTAEIRVEVKTLVYIPSPLYGLGDTVEIPVDIAECKGVAGFQMTIIFDPNVLEPTGAVAGGLTAGWTVMPNAQPGQIQVGGFDGTLQGLAGGSGTLLIVKADIVGDIPGEGTEIIFEEVQLNDNNAEPIPSATEDGLLLGGMPGDINRDNVINIADVILCLRMAIQLPVTIKGEEYEHPYPAWLNNAADINGDGVVNIADVIRILRLAIGLD